MSKEITAASIVLDVSFTVRVEQKGPGTFRYTVEAVTGPEYVDGFDLYYNAEGEEISESAADTATIERLTSEAKYHYEGSVKSLFRAADSLLRR